MSTVLKNNSDQADSAMLDSVEAFARAGFGLHWLHNKQKKPIGNGWERRPVQTIEQLRKSYCRGNNVGVRLGEFSRVDGAYLHLIDLDIRKPEQAHEAWAKLRELFPDVNFDALPSVISGSGGESRHLYFVTDQPFTSRKLGKSDGYEMVFDPKKGKPVEKKDWEIELFGGPKQAVMPPSIHPDSGLPYRWEREFDFDSFDDVPSIPVAAVEHAGAIINDPDDDYVGNTDRLEISLEEAEDILAALPLDPWCFNRGTYAYEPGWLKVGMALKHEFGDQGYDLWCEFSQQSAKYEEREQHVAWDSFKGKSKRPFRMASLLRVANEQKMIDDLPDLPDLPDPVEGQEYTRSHADVDDEFDRLLRDTSHTDDEAVFTTGDEEESESTAVARLNRDHAVVIHGGKTLISTEREDGGVEFGTYHDFKLRHENDRRRKPGSRGGEDPSRYESVAALWIRHRDRLEYVNGVVFAPGGAPKGALNLWKGWAVSPNPGGSCGLLLDHVREVVCRGNLEHAAYVFGWMAHLVQKPEEKPGVALILRGLKGTGKDTLGVYLSSMIGRRHAPTVSQSKHITGNFNRHLEATLLLHVQEGIWAGNLEAESQLKALVTSESLQIERKGVDIISLDNFMRIMITSNADWTVPASFEERRWAVFDVSDKHAGDHAYFTALYAELNNGGPAALLAWLQAYDISTFNVRAAPKTSGLMGQKLASLRNLPKWWFERLGAGELDSRNGYGDDWSAGGIRVLRSTLRDEYKNWYKERKFEGEMVAEKQFGALLRKMVPGIDDHRPSRNGERVREYLLPDLLTCRQQFESYMGDEIDWTE